MRLEFLLNGNMRLAAGGAKVCEQCVQAFCEAKSTVEPHQSAPLKSGQLDKMDTYI